MLFDAATNALFDLQQIDFGINQAHQVFHALVHIGDFEHFLFFIQLERHVRGDGVGQPRWLVDARQRGQDFRRDLFVEFDVLVKRAEDGARQDVQLTLVFRRFVFQQFIAGDKKFVAFFFHVEHAGALSAFYQHLDGAVRQFQQLQNGRQRADFVHIVYARLIDVGAFLRHQQNLLVVGHGGVQRLDGFFAAHKQRDNHVGINHHVAQWKNGNLGGLGCREVSVACRGHNCLFVLSHLAPLMGAKPAVSRSGRRPAGVDSGCAACRG